jgi:hypothetical protein
VIFVPEWPKWKFVSFWLASFCWQNHYYVMLLLSQGCRIFQSLQIFRVYFSDVERVVLWQVSSVTSFMKAISIFKEDSVQIPTQRSRIPSNIRTLGQSDSTRSLFSEVDTVWEVSASRPADVATRPNDV